MPLQSMRHMTAYVEELRMTLLDKAIAAITPPESEEARLEARKKAEAIAVPGSWLDQILEHHRGIEAQFEIVRSAADAGSRRSAEKKLGELLTAHSIAEEAAIYPALAADHQVGHAELAYQEQSAAKMEMGLLERTDPMSEDYLDKLDHIRGAVLHHIYSEEGTWFLKLAESVDTVEQDQITARYTEEYQRYIGR
jgi:hemerythrin superfamily protein